MADNLDTEGDLLAKVQDYLKLRLERIAPDAVLTLAWVAWEQFFRFHTNVMRGFAVRWGVPASEIDDVVEEVWKAALAGLLKLEWDANRGGLRAWLNQLVRSKAGDLVRHKRRHPTQSLGDALGTDLEPLSREPSPSDVTDQRWEHELLQTVLAEVQPELSEIDRQVLQLRCLQDRPVAEVAAVLGLSPENIRVRRHRVLQKLRAHVAVYCGRDFGGA